MFENSNNSKLQDAVATSLGVDTTAKDYGVPFIVIGKKYLKGYGGVTTFKQMINIAKQFGCDIPFFINKNISYVKGYGEKIKTLKVKENNSNILLVIPNFKINTKVLYQNFKEFRKDRTKLFLKNK